MKSASVHPPLTSIFEASTEIGSAWLSRCPPPNVDDVDVAYSMMLVCKVSQLLPESTARASLVGGLGCRLGLLHRHNICLSAHLFTDGRATIPLHGPFLPRQNEASKPMRGEARNRCSRRCDLRGGPSRTSIDLGMLASSVFEPLSSAASLCCNTRMRLGYDISRLVLAAVGVGSCADSFGPSEIFSRAGERGVCTTALWLDQPRGKGSL